MFTSTTKATQTPKSMIEKSRDYIHEKVATEEQLMKEKPFTEQMKAKIPADSKEAAEKIDSTYNAVASNVKEKFHELQERVNEGTESMEQHKNETKESSSSNGLGIKNKIYEATKSPEVKEREDFRQKPLKDKLATMADNKTNESIAEVFAS